MFGRLEPRAGADIFNKKIVKFFRINEFLKKYLGKNVYLPTVVAYKYVKVG